MFLDLSAWKDRQAMPRRLGIEEWEFAVAIEVYRQCDYVGNLSSCPCEKVVYEIEMLWIPAGVKDLFEYYLVGKKMAQRRFDDVLLHRFPQLRPCRYRSQPDVHSSGAPLRL